jgi:CheY-like chemotaxis protein
MVDIPKVDPFPATLEPGQHVCLKVSDTGSGIDPAIINRIFDPYFTTKGKGKGTGMGLSVIHGIVNACHGDIQVESRMDRGSTFSVYLPCVDLAAEKLPDTGNEPIPGGDERILLVDDEVMIVDMISLTLNRLGYQVTARTAGIEALEIFRADPHRFDLVITDLTMPNITGDRLIRELKTIRANIPIILCTGFSQKINTQQAADMGIAGLVLKPVLQRDLAKVIRQALDHPDDAVMT